MAEELKITAGIDGVPEITKGFKDIARAAHLIEDDIKRSTETLKAFEAQLKKASDPKTIAGLTSQIDNLKKHIAGLNTELGGRGVKGINAANNSLINFGRIVQDAPFGIIGITNNINPLLESFQRLKAESGSTGTALKALGSSLIGAGGLGIAISVVSSLLTVFALNNRGAGEEVKKSKEKVDEAAEAQKKFSQAIDSSAKTVVGQQQKLKDLNKTLADTTNKYNELSTAVINQAVAQFLASSKEDVVQKALSLRVKEALKLQNIGVNAIKEFNQVLFRDIRGNSLVATSEGIRQIGINASKALPLLTREEALAQLEAKNLASDLQNVNNVVNNLNLQDVFAKIFNPESKTRAKETIRDVIADLNKELESIDAIGIALGTESDKIAKDKISAVKSTVEKLIKDFNVPPDDTIIAKLLGNKGVTNDIVAGIGNNLKSLDLRTQLVKAVTESVEKTGPVDIIIPANVQLLINNKDSILKPIQDKIALDGAVLNAFIKDTIVNLGVTFGEALGNAFSGQDVSGLFDNLFKSFGAGLKQLGKYFLQTAVEVAIFKKLITLNPALAAAAGIALIALGQIIQNQTSKKSAFATGGVFQGNGVFLAGERGPELISAPAGTRITPASQTNSILGSGGRQEIFGTVRIGNKDLVIAFTNGEKQLGRQI